jgi:protein involved in ribonucleotide reduction
VLIVYASSTGNVKRFVEKLDIRAVSIDDIDKIDEPYVLVTYTTGFGQVPNKVLNFLEKNNKYLIGVSASGNRNWGNSFALSADKISKMYNVPIVHKFELSGEKGDVIKFKERVRELYEVYRTKQRNGKTV